VILCPPKTEADLEWHRILVALKERTMTAAGKKRALALSFADSGDEARRRIAAAKEAHSLLVEGYPLPLSDLEDTSEAMDRIRVGAPLGPKELCDLARMLGQARVLRRYLSTRRESAPTLFAECSSDPTLDRLEEALTSSFDAGGTLKDTASPRLKELRSEHATARTRMIARLEELMGKYDAIIQDTFVTEREGRYVIPVRSDAHERFPGIVHSTSHSGSTLFVEPRAVIPMGNRLKVLEAEVAREEIAIYTKLSTLVGESLGSAEAADAAIAQADLFRAVAQLAVDIDLRFPEITDAPILSLKKARHPILLLDGVNVVASDLEIEAGRAAIVSGPNAGGKTVALKTLGLVALLVRAGLPVPADESSVVGIFDAVLTDVGDDQSLQKNLSTFSAHIRNVVSILQDTHRGALVLLDELAGGTDPREGEALAAGVLDSLTARGGAAVVTTHYEGLKALAHADPRFVNASVGFDLATMSPTFVVAFGIPGSSSALSVARRFGMPSTVIERAEKFMTKSDTDFETVVRSMNDEKRALELARSAVSQKEAEIEAIRTELEEERTRQREREHRKMSEDADALSQSIRRVREELRNAQAALRTKKNDPTALREAQKTADRAAASFAIGGELEHLVRNRENTEEVRASVDAKQLRVGSRVYVPKLRANAEVLSVAANGDILVAAGALKVTLKPHELAESAESSKARPKSGKHEKASAFVSPSSSSPEAAFQTSDNSCDLRGLDVVDALAMATTFLDRSLNEGRRVAFLIHGHGTGAVRDAIRKELRTSSYVTHFRPGSQNEGGDGVTVAWLA